MEVDFKNAIAGFNGLWCGLACATNLWGPVDAGYATTQKFLIAIEHRKWLDIANNADR